MKTCHVHTDGIYFSLFVNNLLYLQRTDAFRANVK